MENDKQQSDRQHILELVGRYAKEYLLPDAEFQPGHRVNYAGRVFDEKEVMTLVDSSLDFWLTAGRYAARFEKEFAEYVGVKHCSLTNSGSSAVLLAFYALTAQELGDRRIRPGDEVITVAAGFPTTVAPIIQYGAIPVFVDVKLPTYNIDETRLKQALSPKTKAVVLAHTLGNTFNIQAVTHFCKAHGLWLIEDNCDALGSEYTLNGITQKTGSFGDIGCSSFYPPHHMTMGEGGAVYTNDALLHRLVNSFRDWGRDCCCPPGQDNVCKHRFDGQYGELPRGYDHKYVYSHFGFNLKVTDMQAAIGCEQLAKLPAFTQRRRENWAMLREALTDTDNIFILPEPEVGSSPSWFGFVLTVREDAGVDREAIVRHVEKQNIQTRMLFAGNLLCHPCFDEMRQTSSGYRVVGNLDNTNLVMRNTFWVGVYPGMTPPMIEHMANVIHDAVARTHHQ